MTTPTKIINHPGFIADLRAAHKGQGPMKLRGRNKNRKQYYPEKNRTITYKDGSTYTRPSRYQQDLPVQFATHFAFYGNESVLKSVANIYKANGINVFAVPGK